ncbi:hypothetical protein ACFE04_023363 [Oxalis oulophora]
MKLGKSCNNSSYRFFFRNSSYWQMYHLLNQSTSSEEQAPLYFDLLKGSMLILILYSENLDIHWDSEERHPKGFRAEILFGGIYNVSLHESPTIILNAHAKGEFPIGAFSRIKELLSGVDLVDKQ